MLPIEGNTADPPYRTIGPYRRLEFGIGPSDTGPQQFPPSAGSLLFRAIDQDRLRVIQQIGPTRTIIHVIAT